MVRSLPRFLFMMIMKTRNKEARFAQVHLAIYALFAGWVAITKAIIYVNYIGRVAAMLLQVLR
jgi:hypothetical protein